MTKEEILNYVMDTPENTNRAVLNDMLNELQTSGGATAFTVTFTPTDADWTTFTADKTLAEVLAAYEAGSIINGRYGTEDTGYTQLELDGAGNGYAVFEHISVDVTSQTPLLMFALFRILNDGVRSGFYNYSLTAYDDDNVPTIN